MYQERRFNYIGYQFIHSSLIYILIHSLIWIKDAPSLTESSIEDVRQFIDKYQHCYLPSESEDPQLRNLILARQKHKHRDYCTRNIDGRCRFRFPKWPLASRLNFIETQPECHKNGYDGVFEYADFNFDHFKSVT